MATLVHQDQTMETRFVGTQRAAILGIQKAAILRIGAYQALVMFHSGRYIAVEIGLLVTD